MNLSRRVVDDGAARHGKQKASNKCLGHSDLEVPNYVVLSPEHALQILQCGAAFGAAFSSGGGLSMSVIFERYVGVDVRWVVFQHEWQRGYVCYPGTPYGVDYAAYDYKTTDNNNNHAEYGVLIVNEDAKSDQLYRFQW
eukprot:PhF_6_TR31722/c0_g1_i1/m.46684